MGSLQSGSEMKGVAVSALTQSYTRLETGVRRGVTRSTSQPTNQPLSCPFVPVEGGAPELNCTLLCSDRQAPPGGEPTMTSGIGLALVALLSPEILCVNSAGN